MGRTGCGTIEHLFDIERFFANAAWWRLTCIAYNVLSVMKRKDWAMYRMKALRFFLIGVAGRIIRTGRQLYLRFAGMASAREVFQEARRKLVTLSNTA